ncbi:MAG: hypothetical protein KBD50_01775 [Candidatus Pacebacteria bacterium]|nr:hypothetical protein [Candidatus Paceibacterota bacterium]
MRSTKRKTSRTSFTPKQIIVTIAAVLFVAVLFSNHASPHGEVSIAEAATAKKCLLDGATVAHNDTRKFFSAKSVASNKSCDDVSLKRQCKDGKLSGNDKFKYASCTKETPPLGVQGAGYVYMQDSFNKEGATSPARFSDKWGTGPCSVEPHSSSARPGSVVRSGSCMLKQEGGDSFVRFTVYPFDVRNTDEDDGEWGKGGGETTPRNTIENAYGYAPNKDAAVNKKGWDLAGKKYLVEGNTVRYSWNFRINDVSLLEPVSVPGDGVGGVWATRPLVPSAVIGQFHSQGNYLNFTNGTALSCGTTVESSSPSPGLFITKNGTDLIFSMTLKMEEGLMPSYLSSAYKNNCETQSDRYGRGGTKRMCTFSVWSARIPKTDVLNKWFTVQVDTKIAASASGSIKLAFGRTDLSSGAAAGFKTQKFLGGSKDILDSIPTKQNSCPSEPRIGVYALRYNPLYYADYENNAATTEFDEDAMKAFRESQSRNWISNAYAATFLKPGDNPLAAPRFIIDYDNFSITQQAGPVAASQGWWSNVASVFSGWFGMYPAEKEI